MMRSRLLVTALLLALGASARAHDLTDQLTNPLVPRGLGVNIHFTDPKPGEMERFAEGGFGLARMDFAWGGIERERGVYNFEAYDRLYAHLEKAGARPLFILDYANRLYDDGQAPHTEAGRTAFARFAAAAAKHFADRSLYWEIWNEPNLDGFWKPKASAEDYAALALATAKAIREADPDAVILAPGSSEFPWVYLERIFQAGLLDHISAVSVHPYRGQAPETAAAEYARLRGLIARYAPKRRQLPIVSSEWGYSTATPHQHLMIPEDQQARYLAREWLANLASDVNVSIFYDWKDDGPDASEREHRFGTVRQDLTPKPAFLAAKELIANLSGYSYRHRLAPRQEHDWRLLFQKGESDALVLAEWSADPAAPSAEQTPRFRKLAPSDPEFPPLRRLAEIRLPAGALAESIEDPASLGPVAPNIHDVRVRYRLGDPPSHAPDVEVTVGEKYGDRVSIPLSADGSEIRSLPIRFTWNGEPLPEIAPLTLVRSDPIRLAVVPRDRGLSAVVENPAKKRLQGSLTVQGQPVAAVDTAGQERLVVDLQKATAPGPLALIDSSGKTLATAPIPQTAPLGVPAEAFRTILHVDNRGQAPTAPPRVETADPEAPAAFALGVPYRFDPGWRYLTVSPDRPLPIPAGARSFSVWIHADGSGNALRCRLRDATGQTFQPDLGTLDWTGWRPVRIPLDGTGTHWGGADDGKVHPPLAWEALVLIDSAHRERTQESRILLSSPSYILEP